MPADIHRRNTQQRRVVLEELRKLRSHPTAAELHEFARKRLPRISLGTVYRNLDLLVQMGEVRKLELGGAEARFDGDASSHYHVRCVECGRVDDASGLTRDDGPGNIRDLCGYRILGHTLEFVGVCPRCQS